MSSVMYKNWRMFLGFVSAEGIFFAFSSAFGLQKIFSAFRHYAFLFYFFKKKTQEFCELGKW